MKRHSSASPHALNRASRLFVVIAPVLLLLPVLFWPGDAAAHGKRPDLLKHCIAVYSGKGIKLPFDRKWRIRYSKKNRRWECYLPQTMGFNTVVPEHVKVLDVADACWRQFRTPKVHFHEGSNVKSAKSVHCGKTDGTVAKGDSGKSTVLRLCNRSSTQKIFASYAFWDTRNRRDKGWTSIGWYKVERGKCRDLKIGRPYKGDIYIRGEGGGSTWSGGTGSNFCIDGKKSFEFIHGDKTSCRGGNRKRVKMSKFKLRHGTVTYNFR